MKPDEGFFNRYQHNFVRVAVAIPPVRVADPSFNASQSVELMREAASRKALIVAFHELGLFAYSREDLFQQQALLAGGLRSSRSDYRAPSDAEATVWLAELACVPDEAPDRSQ